VNPNVPIRRAAVIVAVSLLWPGIVRAQETSPRAEPSPPDAASAGPASPPAAPSTAAAAPAASVAPSATPAAASSASSDATLRQDITALQDEVRSLRAEVQASRPPLMPNAARTPDDSRTAPAKPAAVRPLGYEPFWPWVLPPEGISLGGYLQTQYESHQDSQDQLLQGGASMNKNRFSVRRARVGLNGEWEYVAIALQLDANTTNGPQVDLRKAEASLQYRPDRSKPPIVMATLGQFDTPFGYELVESPQTRWFMERSVASQAFWPGEPDLGVRFAGALGFFRWTISLLNGEPLGEKSPYVLQDPNSAKDAVFRFGFDAKPVENVQTAGGISALRGTGFHAGADTTKSTLQWSDVNGDAMVEPIEIVGVTGKAASPSANFERWAVGADLRTNVRTPLGVTKVYGEFILASNMDRGLYIADPTLTHIDQRELGFYAGVTQEICRYGIVGLRFDYYNPNFDALDNRAGQVIPFTETIKTYSPLAGLVLPGRARLLFQYDVVRNALARTSAGVPTDLKSNVWTLRLQVEL
jgi:Phosphate-selective porin O and P